MTELWTFSCSSQLKNSVKTDSVYVRIIFRTVLCDSVNSVIPAYILLLVK